MVYYRLEKRGVYIDGQFDEKLMVTLYGVLEACEGNRVYIWKFALILRASFFVSYTLEKRGVYIDGNFGEKLESSLYGVL
jgi:hypothetical protein